MKMLNLKSLRKYPAWQNAVDVILERFQSEGFGMVVTHDELDALLELKKPVHGNYEQYKKYHLQRLNSTSNIKRTLLEEYQLCFENVKEEGYMIVPPAEQVKTVHEKRLKTIRKALNQAMKNLFYVQEELLSLEENRQRNDSLAKLAWVQAGLRKKKIPGASELVKKISDGKK